MPKDVEPKENVFDIFIQDMLNPNISSIDDSICARIAKDFKALIRQNPDPKPYIKTCAERNPDKENVKRLWQLYQELEKKPDAKFNEFFNFISPLFEEYVDDDERGRIDMIGSRRKQKLFSEKTQLMICKTLLRKGYYSGRPEESTILEAIALNPYSSTEDKVMAAKRLRSPDIARKAIEALEAERDAELAKDFTSEPQLRATCRKFWDLYDALNRLDPDYFNEVSPGFNIEKLKDFGFEYVKQFKQSLVDRALEAERLAKEQESKVQAQDQQIEKLNGQLKAEIKEKEDYKAKLDTALKEKAALEKQLRDAENARARLANQLDEVEKKLRAEKNKAVKFKDAAAALETGWGSKKGIEAFKKEIAEAYKDETYQI